MLYGMGMVEALSLFFVSLIGFLPELFSPPTSGNMLYARLPLLPGTAFFFDYIDLRDYRLALDLCVAESFEILFCDDLRLFPPNRPPAIEDLNDSLLVYFFICGETIAP